MRGARLLAGAGVAVAFACTLLAARAQNDRSALIDRWNRTNPHAPVALRRADVYPHPPANLTSLAKSELARGYRLASPQPALDDRDPWWVRAWNWLTERWQSIWNASFGKAHLDRRGATAIGDVLILAALAAVGYAAWRLFGGFVFDRRRARDVQSLVQAGDPAELYRRACDLASAGDFTAASQALFAATVAVLAARGVAAENRSATVGDLRRTVGRSQRALLAGFDAVSAAFVTGTYAERPVDARVWENALHGYAAMTALDA